MIDHWLSEKGRKAIEKGGGWPRWPSDTEGIPVHSVTLEWYAQQWVIVDTRDGLVCDDRDSAEALFALRDDKSRWLWDTHQIVVVRAYGAPHEWEALQVGDTDEISVCLGNDYCDDYDEALIDAILAVPEGETP